MRDTNPMKIKINGITIAVKNLDSARIRDIAELQQQTGMKLPEIRDAAAPGSVLTPAILAFLSMRGAGQAFSWEDATELSFNDIAIISEPGDVARASGADAPDPQKPSGASAPDAAAPEEEQPSKPRPSKPRSPGSTSK